MSPHAFGWSSFGESTTDEDDDEVEGSDQDAVVVGRNTVRGATKKMSDLAYKFEALARKCEPKPWYRLLADHPDRPKTLYWLEKRVVCLEEQLNETVPLLERRSLQSADYHATCLRYIDRLEEMTKKHRKALRRVSSLEDTLREYEERERMAEEDLTSRRLEGRIAIRALSLENEQLRVHRSELEESLEECRGLVREMEEEDQRRVQMMDDERSEWRTREEQLSEKLRETEDGLARAQGDNRKVLDFLESSTEQYIVDATEWKRTLKSLSSQVKEIDYERAKAAEMIRGLEESIELRVKEWRDVEARLRREVDIGREKSEVMVAEAARCRKKLVGVEKARTVAESNLATIRLEFTRRERELLGELSALTTELADTKEELAQTLDTLNSVDVDEESNHPYLQYGVPVMGPRKLRGEVLCVGCRNRLVYAGYGSRSAGDVPPKLGEVVEDFLLDYDGAKQRIKLRRNLDRAHHEADRRKGHRGGRPMSREDSREARTRPCTREVATPERPVRVRKGVVGRRCTHVQELPALRPSSSRCELPVL